MAGLKRIDVKFEPEIESAHQPIYESMGYRPRTQVTNHNFKGKRRSQIEEARSFQEN